MTLITVPTERFWSRVSPAVVHRGVAVVAAPIVSDAKLSDAAAPTAAPVAVTRITATIRRKVFIWVSTAFGRGGRSTTARPAKSRYPLITTLMAVTEVAETTGANVTTMVVPAAGVVPVASPSEAPAAVARVTLYGLL